MARSTRLKVRRCYEEAAKRCDNVIEQLAKASLLSLGGIEEIENTSPAFVQAFSELKKLLLAVHEKL